MGEADAPVGGRLLSELANAMVALHREHFGRGPGAAKASMVDDMVVCVLTDVYTQVERTLIRAGQGDRVRETRQMHQIAMQDEFVAAVERVTRRTVDAFVSSVHFDPDLAVELFLLEPEDPGQPDGSSLKNSSE
jgi:uncharacterized protein YbcI